MRNFLFQWVWKFVKGSIPRKVGLGVKLEDYSARLLKQVSLAKKFGVVQFALLGDSNGENLATKNNMIQFGDSLGLSINLAIAGTRADSWVEFFETPEGHELKLQLFDCDRIVWNIGGNHILQSKMDILESSLQTLKDMFPDSWNCLVPPIHINFISSISGIDSKELQNRIQVTNSTIKKIWGDKAIDTYTPFLNPDSSGEPLFLVLDDAVHFSDLADRKIRIPLIIKSVK